MDSMLHSTALILIIYWAIIFFVFGAGFFIHLLLLVAFIITSIAFHHGKRI